MRLEDEKQGIDSPPLDNGDIQGLEDSYDTDLEKLKYLDKELPK